MQLHFSRFLSQVRVSSSGVEFKFELFSSVFSFFGILRVLAQNLCAGALTCFLVVAISICQVFKHSEPACLSRELQCPPTHLFRISVPTHKFLFYFSVHPKMCLGFQGPPTSLLRISVSAHKYFFLSQCPPTNLFRISVSTHKFVWDFSVHPQMRWLDCGFLDGLCCWLDCASELSAHEACAQRPPAGASARS